MLCAARQPWRGFCIQPPRGQLNPANPAVYSVLRTVYRSVTGVPGCARRQKANEAAQDSHRIACRDLLRLLPRGEALHLGGDEVFFPCWNASREVTENLAATGRGRGEADFLNLWAEFHAGSLAALDAAAGRRRHGRAGVARRH